MNKIEQYPVDRTNKPDKHILKGIKLKNIVQNKKKKPRN